MQLDRARRVFASHMAAARTRKLTAYEKAELTRARQALRRARRPAGLSKVNPKKGGYSVYVFKAGRGLVYIGVRSALSKAKDIARQEGQHGYEIYGPGGAIVARKASKAPYTPLAPRGNRRRKARRNSASCPTCGRPAGSPYRRKDARGHVVAGCVDPFHGKFDAWARRREAGTIRARLARGRAGKGYGPNPGGLIRMGKLVELRYQRDHGRQPGFYKHTFKVRPVIYYRSSDNSIWIKGGR